MKKVLALLLVCVLLLMGGCSKSNVTPDPTEAPAPTATSQPEPTQEPEPTDEPTAEPTAEPTQEPEPDETPDNPGPLTGPLEMRIDAMTVGGEPTDEINAKSAVLYDYDVYAMAITAVYDGQQEIRDIIDQRFEYIADYEDLDISPINDLTTKASRATIGKNEDSCDLHCVAVYTEDTTYLFMSIVTLDAYAGYMGEIDYAALVEEWIDSIEMVQKS